MEVNLGTEFPTSTAVRETLTHMGAITDMVVAAYVTPTHDGEPSHVTHVRIGYGPNRRNAIGLGITVSDPDQLTEAGLALIQAGHMLRQDQAAAAANA